MNASLGGRHGLYALRGALLAHGLGRFENYHAAMFRAAWVESREVSSFASVVDITRALGMPEIARALEDVALKLSAERTPHV